MSWRNRLRSASFRGIPFQVERLEHDCGRRVQLDMLPGRDVPVSGDLGRLPRDIQIEAFIVGPDYMDGADALEKACNDDPRPGGLLHPTLGLLIVRCLRARRAEDRKELGQARFSLQFVVVQERKTPIRRVGGTQAVDATVSAAADASALVLTAELAVAGVPAPVVNAAVTEVEKVGEFLSGVALARAQVEKGAQLAANAAAMIRQAQTLVLEPANLAALIRESYTLVIETAEDSLQSLDTYRNLAAFRPNSYQAAAVHKNATLVGNLARVLAVGGWASSAARVKWPSYEDALAARRALESELDSLAPEVSDGEFAQLGRLRARLVGSVPPAGQTLPHVRSLTLPAQLPGLVLAYRLYDDLLREAELLARNHVRHPGMFQGLVPIEVLVDG